MSETKLSFDGDQIRVGAHRWKALAQVLDAAQIGDLVVLVLDWTLLSKERFGQVQNLRAYTFDGQEVWTAEHPTNMRIDCYTNIIEREPLVVNNFSGCSCLIDPSSGHLLESTFTK